MIASLVIANSCNAPTAKNTILVMASLVIANSRDGATEIVRVLSEKRLTPGVL